MALDVRPARWLHGSDSAWLLFGVCSCLAPSDCCGGNVEVAADDGGCGGDTEEIRSDGNDRCSVDYRVIGETYLCLLLSCYFDFSFSIYCS